MCLAWRLKVKQSTYKPGKAQRLPDFQSALEGGKGREPYALVTFTPQEVFLVLVSVRG